MLPLHHTRPSRAHLHQQHQKEHNMLSWLLATRGVCKSWVENKNFASEKQKFASIPNTLVPKSRLAGAFADCRLPTILEFVEEEEIPSKPCSLMRPSSSSPASTWTGSTQSTALPPTPSTATHARAYEFENHDWVETMKETRKYGFTARRGKGGRAGPDKIQDAAQGLEASGTNPRPVELDGSN